MHTDTIEGFTKLAERRIAALRASPGGFFVASMLAGAYLGIGIILIFVLGQQAPLEFQKLIMGATFGIALTLVVIAGAELFTGHTMFMAIRAYRGMGTLGGRQRDGRGCLRGRRLLRLDLQPAAPGAGARPARAESK